MLVKLFLITTLTRRKIIILLVSIIIISLFILFQSNIFIDKSIQYLETDSLWQSYVEMFNFVEIFTILITIFLIYDHDEEYHQQLIAGSGRYKCFLAKYIAITTIVSLFYLAIITIYLAIPTFFSVFMESNYDTFILLVSSYLSHLILIGLVLLITTKNTKNLAFLIMAIFIFYRLAINDNNLALFYLLPINSEIAKAWRYGVLYQFSFVLLLLIGGLLVNQARQIK